MALLFLNTTRVLLAEGSTDDSFNMLYHKGTNLTKNDYRIIIATEYSSVVLKTQCCMSHKQVFHLENVFMCFV